MDTFAPEPVNSTPVAQAPANIALIDDPAEEAAREESFSADFFWNDELLQPFSLERYNIFVTQRSAMAAPSLGRALQDGAAFFPDALRILWLCSQPSHVLSALRSQPEAMQARIEKWAEDHAPVHRSNDIIPLGVNIFNSAFDNRHETIPSRAARAVSGN